MQKILDSQRLVEVIPITGLSKALAYALPEGMTVAVGSLVRVPLGRRSVFGVVSSLSSSEQVPVEKLKLVQQCIYEVPVMSEETIRLARWMGTYYAASHESVFETVIPAPVRKGLKPKIEKRIIVGNKLSPEELEKLGKRAPKQAELYRFLVTQVQPLPKSEILSRMNITSASCDALVEKGILLETAEQIERDAYDDDLAGSEVVKAEKFILHEEQEVAVNDLLESVDKGKFLVHLLHGVTGSGKTEVYLQAIQRVLDHDGGVIFLVPEVALTPQTVGRLRSRFEDKGIKCVVWHSHLSEGERFDGWMRLARGEARVVVGARSAIFAPVHNLKLVVVDEEHEPSYKQAESPRYHGRDVAVYRAMLNQAVCVLGSATPSLESLYNVERGRYRLNAMRKRVDDRKLPRVQLVDMKVEMLRTKTPTAISRELLEKLRDRLENKEQAILFLNRRGYSSSLQCPECGYIAMSPETSVAMTYHRTDDSLRCHLTGHTEKAPTACPECGSYKIRQRGYGTQKIEEVLQKLLPQARIVRMDTDSMTRKNLFREVLGDFRQRKIDILLGTQMIAKGLDFPNVTLVGLIDADISMHMPDFRAAERTFQLIVQVAGRAGRGAREGEVIVQTYTPSSEPVQFARRSDFEGFLQAELENRREFSYPPFRHLVRHLFRGRNPDKVAFYAEQWANLVDEKMAGQVELRGPAPAPLEQLRGHYRFHLWLFMDSVTKNMPKLLELREQFNMDPEVVDVFDVDPVDMM